MLSDDTKYVQHRSRIDRLLNGDGITSLSVRREAFDNAGLAEPLGKLIDKVALRPTAITDEDIAKVRASGFSEDEIFEFLVCAAVGQATRHYESALEALEDADHAT